MEFTDQINNTIRLEQFPGRIVSLVPSQTELLHDLGLGDRVVGITKFCIHPNSWFRTKVRVGGTKQVDLQKVASLNPDLIIANKEENDKEQIEALMDIAPVWVSDIYTLEDALGMIRSLGELTNTSNEAVALIRKIEEEFRRLGEDLSDTPKRKALYYIWYKPGMLAGKKTFIDDMLSRAGYENIVREKRYPDENEVDLGEPDEVLLSSEPFPFGEKHVGEFQKRFPDAKIKIVDGEMFSWYGSRLKLAPAYFRGLILKEQND